MILSINFFRHLKVLSTLIFILFVYVFFIISLFDLDNLNKMFFGLLPFILIFLLPTVYLHVNYFLHNRGMFFELTENEIVIAKKGQKQSYHTSEIHEIIFYMNGNRMKRNAFRNFPFEDYYYVVFKIKNGKEVLLTSLLSDEMDNVLPKLYKDVKIVKKKVFYPVIN